MTFLAKFLLSIEVPKIILLIPRSKASVIESTDRMPPPNWILRSVLDAILEIIERFKRLPDFAPFKSTMWISLNQHFQKSLPDPKVIHYKF